MPGRLMANFGKVAEISLRGIGGKRFLLPLSFKENSSNKFEFSSKELRLTF